MTDSDFELDVAHLALFVGFAFNAAVEKELRKRHPKVRASWGYLIQHLIGAARGIGEIAERMEVSHQAASRAVGQLEELGYVERVDDGVDGRYSRVRLSAKGLELVDDSRKMRARFNEKLVKRVGEKRIEKAREVLGELLDELGGMDRVRARRIVPR